MESQDHFPALLAALHHPNEYVRGGVASTLKFAPTKLAIEPLLELLSDPSQIVRDMAAAAIATHGTQAAGALLSIIQDPPTSTIRSSAEEALSEITDPETVGLLCAALSYPEPEIRTAAAYALGEIGERAAVPALIEAIQHPHPSTRIETCAALGKIGDESAIPAVTALLGEEDRKLREAVILTLGQIGGQQALQPLLTALQDSHWHIRQAAANALINLKVPGAVETFMELLGHPAAWVRQIAAEALGHIRLPATIPSLYTLANEDGDIQVRLSAAQALVQTGDHRGEKIITRTLNAPNANVRLIAAIALGNTGSLLAVEPLLKTEFSGSLHGDNPEDRFLRDRVLTALVTIGKPAVPQLIEALDTGDLILRTVIQNALSSIGSDAVPILLDVLSTSKSRVIRELVIEILGIIAAPEAVPLLEEILSSSTKDPYFLRSIRIAFYDPDKKQRELAARALETINASQAIPTLFSSARYDLDQDVRTAAQRGLATSGDPVAVLALAQPGMFAAVYRALTGLLFLAGGTFFLGLLMRLNGISTVAALVGLAAGGGFGVSDGLQSHKNAIRRLGIGFVIAFTVGFGTQANTIQPWLPVGIAATAPFTISAIFFPIIGAFAGWQPHISLIQRLTGLFVGIIFGFTNTGIGLLVGSYFFS